jgi:hypothetical protein
MTPHDSHGSIPLQEETEMTDFSGPNINTDPEAQRLPTASPTDRHDRTCSRSLCDALKSVAMGCIVLVGKGTIGMMELFSPNGSYNRGVRDRLTQQFLDASSRAGER